MSMILWPAIITLVITLLRLVGELQGWAPAIFNRAAGGGGSPLGISWLPLLFGPFFAWQLARQGKGPENAWKVAGLSLVGVLLSMGAFGVVQAAGLGVWGIVGAFFLALALSFLPWTSWPELSRTLLAYAFASRVPVALVMLVAIFGNWGTHYDVLPPNPTAELLAAGPFARWFYIGFLPQMTLWIAATVLPGALLGSLLVALAKPKPAD